MSAIYSFTSLGGRATDIHCRYHTIHFATLKILRYTNTTISENRHESLSSTTTFDLTLAVLDCLQIAEQAQVDELQISTVDTTLYTSQHSKYFVTLLKVSKISLYFCPTTTSDLTLAVFDCLQIAEQACINMGQCLAVYPVQYTSQHSKYFVTLIKVSKISLYFCPTTTFDLTLAVFDSLQIAEQAYVDELQISTVDTTLYTSQHSKYFVTLTLLFQKIGMKVCPLQRLST